LKSALEKATMKVQAQHLQPGDIVGSGEVVRNVTINSIHWPSNKVRIALEGKNSGIRSVLWGKYTMINIKRNVDKLI
jgi:hypothetical protein